VDKLPPIQWRELLGAVPQRGGLLRWRGSNIGEVDVDSEDRAERPVGSRDDLIERLALPGAAAEIRGLAAVLPATVQLDQDFLRDAFAWEVSAEDYRIVHIASHGYFGGSPEQSFVLTYDEKLTVDDLSGLLRPKRISAAPIELLALSACHTAEGDDRTPLGLSGIALKSGARSVLGSLWPVNDEAARRLVLSFYRELREPGISKAAALAKAQNDLRRDPDFSHPVFWAPFIIVGNWL
jgi:CHAT domain-containing protein